jgi:bacterioferritin-associated ferredoxin
VPALACARLIERHGSEAEAVLSAAGSGIVCRCEALTEAELVHAARHEQVVTLRDAFRRVGLGSGPCAGGACVERAADVIGAELGWNSATRQESVREHLAASWRGRAPLLDRWGWAQEELSYGARRG